MSASFTRLVMFARLAQDRERIVAFASTPGLGRVAGSSCAHRHGPEQGGPASRPVR